MTRTYCTIFDKNYLYQGVALYQSLKSHTDGFNLYALCMDETAYSLIKSMELEGLIAVHVEDILTATLERVRGRTTKGQFCWVCQPVICQYILANYHVDMVTYLEADSLFFSNPEILFDEMGNNSVSLVPHNFSDEFDNSQAAGKFCVQFNAFRNDRIGLAVLEYWREWCFKYNKSEPLKYPGQTNLDDWPEKFKNIAVIRNLGAGVAPWNINGYQLDVESAPQVNGETVVFYHFHQYGRFTSGDHQLGNYPYSQQVIDIFYRPYVEAIRAAENLVHSYDANFAYRREYDATYLLVNVAQAFSLKAAKEYFSFMKDRVRGRYNIFPDSYF
jgi:hypothetical protein